MGKTIIQEIYDKCTAIQPEMKAQKELQHKTNQQIADETGVSIHTINKFFAGNMSNPGIFSLAPMIIDLNMSLDSLIGISPEIEDQSMEIERLKSELAHKDELLEEKERTLSMCQQRCDGAVRELKNVRRDWKTITYAACSLACLLGFFLVVYVVLDARNPNMGLFRRQEISPIVYVAAFSIVLVLFVIAHSFIKKKVGDKNADDTN